MAVLLVVSYAFLFEAVRRRKPSLMFFFALIAAMAASIKPFIAPLGPLLLLLTVWQLRRERAAVRPYIWLAMAGFAAAVLITVGFLLKHGSTAAFVDTLTKVLPQYGTIASPSWTYMLHHSLIVLVPT